MTRRWAFVTVGLAAGFSGLAVILTILSGLPLALFEGALVLVPAGVSIAIVRRAPVSVRREVGRIVRAGLAVGFVATVMYDATRVLLSYVDPSAFDPFGAARAFGYGMLGDTAPIALVLVAGFGVHFVNGISFAVIYAVFAGRHARTLRVALLAGIAWGMTLELVQVSLYPGWLQITTLFKEFILISGVGHLVYGTTLGLGMSRLLFPHSEGEGQK